jgi:hypothetical protein
LILSAVFCLAMMLLTSCEQKEIHPSLILLHTGRLLGNVYPLGFKGRVPLQHYPYLAGYVKQVREEAERSGAQVLLVDLGDSLGGSFASYATGSLNMVSFFNSVGYDAVCLGNLDSDTPSMAIGKLKPLALCPFTDSEGRPAVGGTAFGVAIAKGDFRVRLISNFYGDHPFESDPVRFPAWFGPSRESVTPLREYGPVMSALGRGGPKDLTLFSWMKFEAPEAAPRSFLKQLGKLGVDGILAHRVYGRSEKDVWRQSDSKNWVPPVSENILRRNLGFTVARMDLAWDAERGWTVLSQQLVPMTSNVARPDPSISVAIDQYAEAVRGADEVVGPLPGAFSKDEIFKTYLSALTEIEGVDGVVYSQESIRDAWPAGELRASAVYEALPWTSRLHRLSLSRVQLAKLKEVARMTILTKRGAGDPVNVVTSEYFAAVISRHLGLPSLGANDIVADSEFSVFLRYLKGQSSLDPQAPNEEWSEIE